MNTEHQIAALLSALLVLAPPAVGHADPADDSDPSPAAEPAPRTAPAPPPPVVGFKKGFFIATPDGAFRLTLGGRVQFRFTYENLATQPARTSEAAFELPRVRFKMGGHLFDERIAFAFQMDFAKGQVSLKDAYVDIFANDLVVLRLGQFKTPYSRQFIASSTKQHFVDRAITHAAFAPDRDIGIMVHSDGKATPFEYAVGLFNGTGDAGAFSGSVQVDSSGGGELLSAKQSNVPDVPDPMLVARVGAHTPGFDGYGESDLDNSEVGVGVAGGVYLDFDADDDGDGNLGGHVDFALKARGFSTTGALYVAAVQSGATFGEQGFHSVGGHVSVAYAIRGLVEPALRVSRITDASSAHTTELLAGVTAFFFKHNVKWVVDGGAVVETAGGSATVDARVRTQFQLDY